MKRFWYIILLAGALLSCSDYNLLINKALTNYPKKGATVISYSNPATEDNHILIFEYRNAIYYNSFEKDNPIQLLMNGETLFQVQDYTARLDNDSFQIVLDTVTREPAPLKAILKENLDYVVFTPSNNPGIFLISSNQGVFLFNSNRVDVLIHFVGHEVILEGDKITCKFDGDLRDFLWSEPVTSICYYYESQPFQVDGSFDLQGNLLSFSNLTYKEILLKNPFLTDAYLRPFRTVIDSYYESLKAEEAKALEERYRYIIRTNAIPVSTIMDSFSANDQYSGYLGERVAFYCTFSEIAQSDRSDYKFRLKCIHSAMTKVYLYTNDDSFLNIQYPATLYVSGVFKQRKIIGSFLWMTESDLLFEDGIFAGF